jgi:hypothetical protein
MASKAGSNKKNPMLIKVIIILGWIVVLGIAVWLIFALACYLEDRRSEISEK